jgi:hypothetical protein
VKIRGTANHVAEKYLQLARDAQTSGDPISAENYFQHAEHYLRLIATAQEQFRQNNPGFQPRPEGAGEQFNPRSEDNYEDGDDTQPSFGADAPFGTREPQPYIPPNAQPFVQRDNQPYQPREAQGQPSEHRHQPQPQPRAPIGESGNVESLPAFITGGAPAAQPPQANGQNGYDNQADRFPLHRRRRRHRGPRGDLPPGVAGEQTDEPGPGNS